MPILAGLRAGSTSPPVGPPPACAGRASSVPNVRADASRAASTWPRRMPGMPRDSNAVDSS
eukprot:10665177-Alexandrium_andersonii.AAC.1